MGVDPTDSFSPKLALVDQPEDLVVGRANRERQSLKIRQYARAISKVSARDLADDKGVGAHLPAAQKPDELCASETQVLDPNRCIDQDHALAERRLGTGRNFGWLPPSTARRLPDSLAINALRPSCKRAVFSRIPVRRCARSSKAASMFKVVRICISMHSLYVCVKHAGIAFSVVPSAISLGSKP
jgi:hypothetical protein